MDGSQVMRGHWCSNDFEKAPLCLLPGISAAVDCQVCLRDLLLFQG